MAVTKTMMTMPMPHPKHPAVRFPFQRDWRPGRSTNKLLAAWSRSFLLLGPLHWCEIACIGQTIWERWRHRHGITHQCTSNACLCVCVCAAVQSRLCANVVVIMRFYLLVCLCERYFVCVYAWLLHHYCKSHSVSRHPPTRTYIKS